MANKFDIIVYYFPIGFYRQLHFYDAHKSRQFTNRLFLGTLLWKYKSDQFDVENSNSKKKCVLFRICWMFCQNLVYVLLLRIPFGSNTHQIVWFRYLIVFGNCFAFKVPENNSCAQFKLHFTMCIIHLWLVRTLPPPPSSSSSRRRVYSAVFLFFCLFLVSNTRMFIKQNIHRMWKRERILSENILPTCKIANNNRVVTMQIIRIYICHINLRA